MHFERSPLDGDHAVAVTITARQRDALLDAMDDLVDAENLEHAWRSGEPARFTDERRRIEAVFALLDALGWGLPERASYHLVLTPAIVKVLAAQRDGLRQCVEHDAHGEVVPWAWAPRRRAGPRARRDPGGRLMAAQRRTRGQGSLYVRRDAAGKETWYGHRCVGGRQIKRRIGPKLNESTGEGLARWQAEGELYSLISTTQPPARRGERLTVDEVAARYVAHAERRGRKRATCQNIESAVRVHLAPFFAEKALDAVSAEDVLDLVATLEGKGLAPKTVRNVIGTLSALFTFAKAPQRAWVASNPCEGLELPAVAEATEIRYLTLDDLHLLLTHARPGPFQAIDRALYLTAAMTGLRKGELVALRWRDVDWPAARIRVRQNYTRGEFGTPKSKRSTRSVPMADEVGGELERLFKASRWQRNDDLVFANPATGDVLAKSNVSRRMHAALKAAGLEETHRFHDLRHTFGTRMAAAGVPLRTLQEFMGHRDLTTTQIYADYAPSAREAEMVAAAFARGSNRGSNLSESERIPAN